MDAAGVDVASSNTVDDDVAGVDDAGVDIAKVHVAGVDDAELNNFVAESDAMKLKEWVCAKVLKKSYD